ncbi:MAG: hypothetical protein ACHQT8_07475 [Chlamydiales bacterium]
MARLATWMPFRQASQELEFFTKVEVNEATVRQITEGIGAAQVGLQDRRVAEIQAECPESPDGPELQMMSVDGAFVQLVGGEWKEVKTLALGVVQEPVEEKGEQVVSTTDLSYFSRMSEAKKFEEAALVEIYDRGVEKAGKVCAVTDGADWIPKFVDLHRADAIRILDFAHAMEYVTKVGKAVWERGLASELLTHENQSTDGKEGEAQSEERHLKQKKASKTKQSRTPMPTKGEKEGEAQSKEHEPESKKKEQEKQEKAILESWGDRQAHELKYGEAARVIQEIERLMVPLKNDERAMKTMNTSLNYLKERQSMMTYALFRAQGYPIGSGCVESANKLVVEKRMKGAGMRWAERHVNPMLALRNVACNNRWKEFWKQIRHHLITLVQAKRGDVSVQRLKLRAEMSDAEPNRRSEIQEKHVPLPVTPQELPDRENTSCVAITSQRIPPDPPIKQETPPMLNKCPAANHPWRRPLLRQRPAS